MLDYESALEQLLAGLVPITAIEQVALAQARGCVLAETLLARLPAPRFDHSMMDGYAVADSSGTLTRFTVIGRVAAGEAVAFELLAGQAVRIFTGAALPLGADAVVPQEECQCSSAGELTVGQPVKLGAFIRRKAQELEQGALLLRAGTQLDALALAVCASQGYATVPVWRRLKVTVFSSGKELREAGQSLSDGAIYDANRPLLCHLLASLGYQVSDGGCIADDLPATRLALRVAAQQCDVIVSSAGASVGEEDYLKAALSAEGLLTQWSLAIKPGKPFGWGQLGSTRVFLLPGNPVAALVSFYLLLKPALACLAGLNPQLPWVRVQSLFTYTASSQRREFLRAKLVSSDLENGYQAHLLAEQDSAMLASCLHANALVEVRPGHTVQQGDRVRALCL